MRHKLRKARSISAKKTLKDKIKLKFKKESANYWQFTKSWYPMALFVCEGRSENKKMPKVNDMYSLIGNIMIR